MTDRHERITLDQPGVYEIKVQGLISRHWCHAFKDFQTTVEGEDGWAITTLEGCIIDQAALQGILQQLYTLGLVLLSVQRKDVKRNE
jgi:hypothetical protein